VLFFALLVAGAPAQSPGPQLELKQAARPWEFLDAVGMRAGLFGAQNGRFEAWVYPLKLLREFHLVFRTDDGHEYPAETLARSITMHPESVTVTYSADDFTVDETWFVPFDQPSAAVELNIETWRPLQIEVRFQRDMQLMWPAAVGATWQNWDPNLRAFLFGEETRHYVGLIGAAGAELAAQESETNYSASDEDALRLPPVPKGRSERLIVIAASINGREQAEETFRKISADYQSLRAASAAHYRDYLERTTSIQVPDATLQQAYDWARISMAQGMVNDPLLGAGLVAGYRTSGRSARPGYAWFFGRDSEWTSFALDSIGAFADVRTALEFLMKFQRADGKVEHEIAQTASLVPWFTNYPYPYASADATPLLLIAAATYARESGDIEFLRSHADNFARAYEFLRSTWDSEHRAQNLGVGHGWIEGGALLPVRTELYQAGLGAEAVHAMADMARLTGQADAARDLDAEAERQSKSLDHDFWSERLNAYVYGLDQQNALSDTPSVLTTVPMWFGLLDAAHTNSTINVLAGWDQQADWGMRILSSKDPRYDPSGYHFGSVWPLFTGWAAVGEYRYHRALPAFANLKANALITLAGSPGRTTEVLSGAYFDGLETSSPHQIWSSAMVISPILRGMMGLAADAPAHTLTFAPHVPADWDAFLLRNVWIGGARAALRFNRTEDEITLEVSLLEGTLAHLRFSPAISPHAQVLSVTLNGQKTMNYTIDRSLEDQHVSVDLHPVEHTYIRIRVRGDFSLAAPVTLPSPGAPSSGVRVVSETWNATHNRLELELSGPAGQECEFRVRGMRNILQLDGGSLLYVPTASGAYNPPQYSPEIMHMSFPQGEGYVNHKIVITFSTATKARPRASTLPKSVPNGKPKGQQ
jgi:glycogen debranching enzyme